MASTTSQSPDEGTRRAALVVAVSTYADPALRQLRAPAEDAAELSAVLGDPELGDFSVTTITDGRAQDIRIAVEEFLSEQKPGDLSLVYMSCHGLVDARRRLFFAAADTLKGRLAATGIEARWLLDQLEECRARRQVVILDCCFSGAFATGSKGDSDVGLADQLLGQGRGRVVLTASRGTEYSFEGAPTSHSAIPGSVFTGALAAGIRTGAADSNHDGWITVDDAYTYAFDEMRAAGAEQTPQRWLYGAEGGIVLARNPTAAVDGPRPPTVPTMVDAPSRHEGGGPPATGRARGGSWMSRRALAAAAGIVLVAAVGAFAAYNMLSSPGTDFSFEDGVVESAGPWRMQLFDQSTGDDPGCTVSVTDLDSGTTSTVPGQPAYRRTTWQMQSVGRFRLEPSSAICDVLAEDGAGDAGVPLTVPEGDSEGFNPSGSFEVHVDEDGFNDDSCLIVLKDGETGTTVTQVTLSRQSPTQQMEPGPRSSVYLSNVPCIVKVTDD